MKNINGARLWISKKYNSSPFILLIREIINAIIFFMIYSVTFFIIITLSHAFFDSFNNEIFLPICSLFYSLILMYYSAKILIGIFNYMDNNTIKKNLILISNNNEKNLSNFMGSDYTNTVLHTLLFKKKNMNDLYNELLIKDVRSLKLLKVYFDVHKIKDHNDKLLKIAITFLAGLAPTTILKTLEFFLNQNKLDDSFIYINSFLDILSVFEINEIFNYITIGIVTLFLVYTFILYHYSVNQKKRMFLIILDNVIEEKENTEIVL